jgi:hypothetical protein
MEEQIPCDFIRGMCKEIPEYNGVFQGLAGRELAHAYNPSYFGDKDRRIVVQGQPKMS